MLDYKLKIGIVPDRRYVSGPKRTGIFNPDYAVDNKNKALKFIKENFTDEITEFTDLEWLNEEGLLIETKDCVRVAEYLKQEKVDAIFIVNCNFGNEEAVGGLARMMKLPVLLWGPRDRIIEKDGTRYTDTQCGLFAMSKQLKRYNVPFSYISGCDIEEEKFMKGFRRFLSVAVMVKNFKTLRIVQVGSRVKPFKCVMSNELEMTELFGIDVIPVNLAETSDKLKLILETRKAILGLHVSNIKSRYDTGDISEDILYRMAAFIEFYKEILDENMADVIATECWTAMNLAFGAMPCLSMSILADMGYLVICESDIHGAVTAALLSCAARGADPPLFGEFTCRHPEKDEAELLWHCGVFASSSRKGCGKIPLMAFKPSFCAKDGRYTLARFQCEKGKYYLLGGEFDTTDGPATVGTYMWARFPELERIETKLIEGPYIHHMSEIKGEYADSLKEFCKFIPGIEYDPLI